MPDFASESSDVALRFRRVSDWYVISVAADVSVIEVRANSERIVDLMYRLTADLETVVDVYIDHIRAHRRWSGALRFLPEVREALGRLRWPLASYGGVELTLVTATDQLTVTPSLTLMIYSRRHDWPARLDAEGVTRIQRFPPPVWTPAECTDASAEDLDAALSSIAERLELDPVT